ncbi:MAG: beta-ketoacyl-[acyl-carrier-protein] synthase family protein [Desulfobacteraceae bacterium]|jgi:3-oxoacyl-[acyl-carrier-protein] synthase II
MSTPPVIISYDFVSPLGVDLETQWRRAKEGRSGIGPLTRFALNDEFPVRIAGQAPPIDHLPYPFLRPREEARWPSPVFRYALLTVQRALEKCGLEITADLAPRVAVTFSSAVGGLDAVLAADRDLMGGGKLPLPCVNPNSCINMVGGKVSMLTGATGPICATITACATGLTSMIMGAMLMAQGRADVTICGAVDFALVEPIVAGFASMNGAYVPKEGAPEEPPEAASRPFSINRRGFVISEGAGCIIMATREFARTHGLSAPVQMAGWSMTSDAHHFVAPYLDTVRRCIEQSIVDAGIPVDAMDAVNAHAASTRIGDKVEYDALADVFHGRIPPVTANKSLIGHCMGASSAIETILAVKSLEEGILLPTINHLPDPEMEIDLATSTARSLSQQYVLKNAFGFGGCNACAVFQRTE